MSARVAGKEKQATIAELVAEISRLRQALARAEAAAMAKDELARGPLFKEYASSWLAVLDASEPSPATRTLYDSALRSHLLPAFGNMHLADITSQAVALHHNSWGPSISRSA